MRRALAVAVLGACSSPPPFTDSGARVPPVPNEQYDSGSDDSADWRSDPVEPGDASRLPFGPRSEPELGRPWVDSGGPPLPVFDCSLVPDEPTEINELDAPRGCHDVIFDTEGNLIGSDAQNLRASADPDSSEIWVANAGYVDGMDWLPDGDLVAAGQSLGIVRINPEDGRSVIAPDILGFGVVVGPDGMVYVASVEYRSLFVLRLDPVSGDWDEFVRLPDGIVPRVIDFSPDYSKMYIGTLWGPDGKVFAVDLDEDLEPIGDPYVFAEGVGGGVHGAAHDGIGVDVCGNVYVNEFSTLSFYRITPGGDVSVLKAWTWDKHSGHVLSSGYGHGQDWGSGLGVWRTDAIYAPQPYDDCTVAEVVVGIPGRKYNNGMYEVINVDD